VKKSVGPEEAQRRERVERAVFGGSSSAAERSVDSGDRRLAFAGEREKGREEKDEDLCSLPDAVARIRQPTPGAGSV
jgi:hypothetical protein